MKWAGALLLTLHLAGAAELSPGRTVFLMPMGRGLDQYIASRLTRTHLLQVVTDPAKADTIITDQVGSGFEDRWKSLFPPPPEPKDEDKDAAKTSEKEKDSDKDKAKSDTTRQHGLASMLGDTANKAERPGSMGVYGRARGTIFLVDVQSHRVLWSAFERPRNTTPHELDQTAERIVKKLKLDIEPKVKPAQ